MPAVVPPADHAAGSLLARLDHYLDQVPRATASPVEVGPLTVFVSELAWPYYARPSLGIKAISADDVTRMRQHQRELGQPESLEWIRETVPDLEAAATGAGLAVHHCPLLVLARRPPAPTVPPNVVLRELLDDDAALSAARACVDLAFSVGGTDAGPAGSAERDSFAARARPALTASTAEVIRRGLTRLVVALDADAGPVAAGSHSRRDEVSEVTGVGVLPAYRRRGLGAAVTTFLARQALAAGANTVFCSAQSGDVARIYERLGFRRVGTVCVAETMAEP